LVRCLSTGCRESWLDSVFVVLNTCSSNHSLPLSSSAHGQHTYVLVAASWSACVEFDQTLVSRCDNSNRGLLGLRRSATGLQLPAETVSAVPRCGERNRLAKDFDIFRTSSELLPYTLSLNTPIFLHRFPTHKTCALAPFTLHSPLSILSAFLTVLLQPVSPLPLLPTSLFPPFIRKPRSLEHVQLPATHHTTASTGHEPDAVIQVAGADVEAGVSWHDLVFLVMNL
jgi:hypothetical protein